MLDLQSLPEGRSSQVRSGSLWRIHTASGQRWKVAVVDDSPLRSQWLGRQLAVDLGLYLGLALPIVLIPLWWSVRAALKPLTSLSMAVAARSPLGHHATADHEALA